jgi:ribonucleoside-diphosphate reductase alpha chain
MTTEETISIQPERVPTSTISKIRKRDGRIVNFDKKKISEAIWKAVQSVGGEDRAEAEHLAEKVVQVLEDSFRGEIPSVENVQDIVEKVLIESGHAKTAKAYILYRQKRAEIRKAVALLGVKDDLKLPLNAIVILAARYLRRDENRNIIETTSQLFRRVAKAVASADKLYGKTDEEVAQTEEAFYQMMVRFEFLPNSPTLMNAGTDLGQLSACFVLPVEDSMESIFNALKYTALIHKTGGGTGFSFSKLRPQNDVVNSTGGVASGPLSFISVFDAATNVIKQGGKRRGANMGILRVDHPDILDFIVIKEQEGRLSNFNISVALTDKFMDAVKKDKEYDLINPRNGKVVKTLRARVIWNLIAMMAWKNGEPGIIFIDKVNQHNPTPHVGEIEATNPCGEQPLLPFESCNLGSINLSKMVHNGDVDWEKLRKTVRTAVHFLDNVIDINKYPLEEIEKMTKGNRKIGLGVMGFADMLIQLGIPYNSHEALTIAEKVMKFVHDEGIKMSVELAKERGSFPNFHGSVWEKKGYEMIRNATITTIAPTGTISEIAGCSGGIEPLFSVSYVRNVAESLGQPLKVINPYFERMAIREEIYSDELIKKISKTTSISHVEEIPEKIRKVFVTAHELTPEWHVRMQAAFQKYTHNAVSKTVNFPNDATPQDIEKVFLLAYELGCKGVTVYRHGSRERQVLYVSESGKCSAKEGDTAENNLLYGIRCPTCSL